MAAMEEEAAVSMIMIVMVIMMMRMEVLVIRPNGASKAFRLRIRTCENLVLLQF